MKNLPQTSPEAGKATDIALEFELTMAVVPVLAAPLAQALFLISPSLFIPGLEGTGTAVLTLAKTSRIFILQVSARLLDPKDHSIEDHFWSSAPTPGIFPASNLWWGVSWAPPKLNASSQRIPLHYSGIQGSPPQWHNCHSWRPNPGEASGVQSLHFPATSQTPFVGYVQLADKGIGMTSGVGFSTFMPKISLKCLWRFQGSSTCAFCWQSLTRLLL